MRCRLAPLIALLLAAGVTSCAPDPYPGIKTVPAADLSHVPLAGLDHAHDDILDVEAVTDGDGELHVVWQTYNSDSIGSDRLWYSHGGNDHSPWSRPQLVKAIRLGKLRLVVADSQLHLFGDGDGLRHLVRDRSSGDWRDEGLIGRTSDRIAAFDVIANGSGFVVAYAAYWSPDPDAPFKDMPTKLVVAEVQDDGRVKYDDLVTLPHADPMLIADPRLAVWRSETHVVWSVGTMDTVRGGRVRAKPDEAYQATPGGPWIAPMSRVVAAYRESTEGKWTSSADTWPQVLGSPVRELALVSSRDRLFMFFNGYEASESTDGRYWSRPVRLAKMSPSGNADTGRNFSASADSDAIVVTWSDFAIGVSKTPPLVMSNKSYNTDALAMICSERPATLAKLTSSPLVRVTPTSGFVQGVNARSGHGRPEIVWFGKTRRGSDWSAEIEVARLGSSDPDRKLEAKF